MSELLITGARTIAGSPGDLYIRNGVLTDPTEAPADAPRLDADPARVLLAIKSNVAARVHRAGVWLETDHAAERRRNPDRTATVTGGGDGNHI